MDHDQLYEYITISSSPEPPEPQSAAKPDLPIQSPTGSRSLKRKHEDCTPSKDSLFVEPIDSYIPEIKIADTPPSSQPNKKLARPSIHHRSSSITDLPGISPICLLDEMRGTRECAILLPGEENTSEPENQLGQNTSFNNQLSELEQYSQREAGPEPEPRPAPKPPQESETDKELKELQKYLLSIERNLQRQTRLLRQIVRQTRFQPRPKRVGSRYLRFAKSQRPPT